MRKNVLLGLAFVAFIGLFFFLEPKLSAATFLQSREDKWNQFVTEIKKTGAVDGKKFWEFREFYSPGSFTFNQKGIAAETLSETSQKMNIPSNSLDESYPFLVYQSQSLVSIDSLVAKASIEALKNKLKSNGTIVIEDKNYFVLQKENKAWLVFVLPTDEMKKANGFFNYREEAKDLVQGKYWLNISAIIY